MAAGARLELSNAICINNAIDATGQIGFVSSGNVLADVITNNNTVYNVNAGTTNEVSAYITGKGGLELVVGGVLKVTGTTNDYQGATTISNGTLRVDTLANGGTTNTFVKAGAGEIVLSNGSFSDNFAAAAIQVNAGSLTLGAANQIADGTDLILNGGTFRTGSGSAGYAESLGDLTLNASSTIDLGAAAGLRDLVFIDSSGVAWSGGAMLTVANWAGSVSGGTAGRLFFGSNSSGLGAGQLSQITFSGYAAGAQILGTGELVPFNLTAAVPEPGTYAAAVILLALAIWHHRRRTRSHVAAPSPAPERL